jgi:PAS domain S-box-containing protein
MDASEPATELQCTPDTLHLPSQHLAAIIQSAMDAIVVADGNQRILIFNAAAERVFGCPAATAVGQPLARFIPERFRAAHEEQVRFFSNTRGTCRRMGKVGVVWGLGSNGEEIPLEISISQADCSGTKLFVAVLRPASEPDKSRAADR